MSTFVAGGGLRLLWPRLLAVVLAVIGAVLVFGGVQLLAVGGSAYYAITGIAVLTSAVLLFLGSLWGVWVFAAMLAWTLLWSFAEVGLDGWALMPRLVGPFVIGLYMALPFNWRPLSPSLLPARK